MKESKKLHRWSIAFGALAFVGCLTGMSDVLFAAIFVSAVIIGTAGDILKAFDK